MRSGDTRMPLVAAGVSAGIAYLVLGASSPLDVVRFVHTAAHWRIDDLADAARNSVVSRTTNALSLSSETNEFDSGELGSKITITIRVGVGLARVLQTAGH